MTRWNDGHGVGHFFGRLWQETKGEQEPPSQVLLQLCTNINGDLMMNSESLEICPTLNKTLRRCPDITFST